MNDKATTAVVSVLLGVVGLAIAATLVSSGAKTGSVLGSFGSAIQTMICVAVSPVTGKKCNTQSSIVTSVFNPGGVVTNPSGVANNPTNVFGDPIGPSY